MPSCVLNIDSPNTNNGLLWTYCYYAVAVRGIEMLYIFGSLFHPNTLSPTKGGTHELTSSHNYGELFRKISANKNLWCKKKFVAGLLEKKLFVPDFEKKKVCLQ